MVGGLNTEEDVNDVVAVVEGIEMSGLEPKRKGVKNLFMDCNIKTLGYYEQNVAAHLACKFCESEFTLINSCLEKLRTIPDKGSVIQNPQFYLIYPTFPLLGK